MLGQLIRRSEEEDREQPPTTAWQQFPALLSPPADELKVLSRDIGK
jgi:hypothetical protein